MGDRFPPNDVERTAAIVKNHAHSVGLGALALDVLTRQAEGRALFAGRDFVATRATTHGVTQDAADTSLGNLIDLLAAGPSNHSERGLVAAFAVYGLGASTAADGDDVRGRERMLDFARHADWLEASTDYAVYPFVEALLEEPQRELFWSCVGDGFLTLTSEGDGELDHGVRARGAVRLSALHGSHSPSARGALVRAARECKDPFLAKAAQGVVGESVTQAPAAVASGVVAAPLRGDLVTVLRWITGWAVLVGAIRVFIWLLGVRREASVSLLDGRLRVHAVTRWLGRVVRDRIAAHPLYAVTRVERSARYPLTRLLVGIAALSIGVLAGGSLLAVGARTGETYVALLGAAVIAVGALFDFVLDVVAPVARGRVHLAIFAEPRVRLRIQGSQPEIDAFIETLEQRLARTASRPTKEA